MTGVPLRSDIVEVYVFTQATADAQDVQFLQLRRAVPPVPGSWQPVMGHLEPGETAAQAALRELDEETGLTPMNLSDGRGFWQLEAVNTFFMASLNAIVMSPGFAVQVTPSATPTLDQSHDGHRWVPRSQALDVFLWPGQHTAIRQILDQIAPPRGPLRQVLRLP